ncbi:MAG: hypothetical protein ABID63_18245 [Pseudomonadota bacterium]
MATVADLMVRIEANTQQLRNELRKGEQHLNGFEGRVNRSTLGASSAFDRLGASARATIAIMAGFGVGFGVAGIATGIAQVNAQFQDLYSGLKVATGSAQAADVAFDGLRQFAKETPFQLSEVVTAFVRLKNLGLDPGIESLRAYGDLASSFAGKSVMDFIEAVADAATGEFERLKEFGIKASSEGNKVSFTFRQMTTTVGKNAGEIERYLQDLARNNFGGAMAEKMDNLSGRTSNLKDRIDDLYVTIGQRGGIDVMAAALDTASASVDGLKNNLDAVATVIALVAAAAAGKFLGPMIASMGASAIATATATVQLLRFQAVLPAMAVSSRAAAVGLAAASVAAKGFSASVAFLGGPVGAAITVLAGGIYLLSRSQTDAQGAADLHREAMEQLNGVTGKGNEIAKTAAELTRDTAKARVEDARAANEQVLAATRLQMAQLKEQRGLLERSSPGSPLIEGVNAELTALSFELVAAKERVDDLESALIRLDTPGEIPPKPTGTGERDKDAEKEAEKIAKVIESLRFQQEQLTRTSREQAVFTALQQAGVDASHAQADAIRQAALAYYDANDAVESLAESIKAEDAARASIGNQIADLRLENQLLQVQGIEREKLRAILEAEAVARKGGIPLRDTERAQIEDLITANEKLKKAEEAAAEAARDARQFARDFGNVIASSFEDAVISGGKLSDVLKSLEQDIARIILRMAVTKPLENAIGSAFGSFDFGSMFGSLFSSAPTSGPGISYPAGSTFAKGGIMTGAGPMDLPMRAYASGGIANSPQLAMFGEGSMPEAYVPLPDGRSIPVTMQGGGENFTYAPVINVDARNSTLSAGEIKQIVDVATQRSVSTVRDLQRRKGNARI